MKKVIKYRHEWTGKVITLTINDQLKSYEPNARELKKLEEVNEMLRNLKTPLPK